MAQLILSRDWSATPLGPIAGWPQSLRTTVSLCLASNFPINIIWGPHNTQIYNDGYRVICGDKHPASLGMDYAQCWASAWPAVGQPFEQARQGQTSFLENQRMFLFRNGYLEETFFTFSLSPIRDESGAIGGLFHPVTETTRTMLSERRTRALRDLNAALGEAHSRADLYARLTRTLAQFAFDLPFVLLYERSADGQAWRRRGCVGLAPDTALSPELLAPAQAGPWLAASEPGQHQHQISGLANWLDGVACGPYDEAPHMAYVLPLGQAGAKRPDLLLLAGASPRLPLDDAYAGFYDLLRAAVDAAVARVDAVEEERERAQMLAAIDRAKTVFFSNVSHEFRTPLTLMLGPIEEALESDDLTSGRRQGLEIAHRNARRLQRLVTSLLDFSRIEAGRMEARYVETDLGTLTAELASNFRSACERAGIGLEVDCAALPAAVHVDPSMWEKIVLNLLSNAFKFTLEGGIRLALRDAGGMAELTVADSGVGIPAADLERVFDRFHRVEGQGGRSVEGSGIGLSLVRELVRLHGGSIEVDSAPGQGAVFTVRLPYGAAHLPADQLGAPLAAAPPATDGLVDDVLRWLPGAEPEVAAAAAGAQGRVLLADDNADMRAYIERILVDGGYTVQAVANGRQALAALRGGAPLPDLVLSDVMMPELDGFGLLAALRADPATSAIVMLLLSARAGEEARLEGLQAGADDYLVKPFGARELRARVDGAVRLARQRRKATAREQTLQLEVENERGKTALLRSEAHAAALFEQTTAGMVESDVEGRMRNVNARFCQLVGRQREALLGQRFESLVHPDDLEDNRRLFDTMLRDGVAFEVENRVLTPDGGVLWVAKTVTPIRFEPGQAPTVLGVYIDVTERRLAQQALQEASRRKDEFLAMLAHELRNPLAPIRAAAELMGMVQLDSARLKRTSEVIGRQVRHMTALVDDLLDVSRVTRGLVEIERTPQDVRDIVTHALEQVRPLVDAQRHRLEITLDPAVAWVLGDQKRLVQILTNLLNNAAKYTPPGGLIRLHTEVEPEVVHFSVSDNGIGIAPALQAHVFDLFAQAERTPDRSQGGLGLGLALVKSLVELHGGRVACHSAGPGKGSTFIVELPRLADANSGAAAALDATLAAPGAAAPAAGTADMGAQDRLDILVVDDNEDAAAMLKILLEESHYTVRVAGSAGAALASVARRVPDVALLDLGLPDLDGRELARRLRADPATAHVALVAVTGYGSNQDRRQTLEAGFDAHLVKPVAMEQLVELLGRLAPSTHTAHTDMR